MAHLANIFLSQTKQAFEIPSTVVFDKKFDTALRLTHVRSLKSRIADNKLTFDDEILIRSKHYPENHNWTSDTGCYPEILRWVLSHEYTTCSSRHDQNVATMIYPLIKKNLELQLAFLNENNHLPNVPTLYQKMYGFLDKIRMTTAIKNLIDMSIWMSTVVEKSNAMYLYYNNDRKYTRNMQLEEISKTNHVQHHTKHLAFSWSHTYVAITINRIRYVMSKPYILMIHNKVCDLLSVLILAQFGSETFLPRDAYETTTLFIYELLKLFEKYGEHFHTIMKSLEAICTAVTLTQVEKWTNTEFIQVLEQELYESTKFQFTGSSLEMIFTDADVPMKHELSCLSKILGHPLVDMEAGSQSLYDKTHEIYELNMSLILQCENYIKENYIRNSIIRFRSWPPHRINYQMAPQAIIEASVRDVDPNQIDIVEKYGRIDINDYSYVELLPNMKFSKLENSITYLKDKTISLCKSRVFSSYLSNNQEPGSRPKWEETRLLLAFMLSPSVVMNHTDYINQYNQSPTLDDLLDYLVIRIVPKEKELKILYRGFGCKHYNERMRALAQEKNAMKFLDSYSDEQAMTLGELQLTRRLLAFRRLKTAYTKHYVIYVNLDASSWNNHFRSETVDDIMVGTLDKIFDTHIYSKTHLAYQKTFFYVPDTTGTYHWEGQAGGIEGLNQDTWVITYLAQIKTALSTMKDIRYHVLCKGDDFRLAIVIPEHVMTADKLPSYKTYIVSKISEVAKQLGHKIKIEDSYGSERYFNFSKSASVDLVELPQTFRKIQKCYGANNAFLSTLDEYIGSSFSSAHSACRVNTTTVGCYAVSLFWTYYYLCSDRKYGNCTNDQLLALTLAPNLVGGFPIIYLHNMFVRAEADLLTPFLELILFTERNYPGIHRWMQNFCCMSPIVPKTMISLYKDPYTLPIDRPALPTSFLRSQILPVLEKHVKNEQIMELITASQSPRIKDLIQCLDTANPCEIKILANLYACLPNALLDEILKKFESARSIYEFFMRTIGRYRACRVLARTCRTELRLQDWRYDRLLGTHHAPIFRFSEIRSPCSFKWAQDVRKAGWGKEICGITMPSLQHLICLKTQASGSTSQWDILHHFTMYIRYHDGKYLTPDRRMHYQEGLNEPFVGYTTRTGTIEPKIAFIEKDVLLTKIKNILDLVSWSDSTLLDPTTGKIITSNVREFIEILLELYTDTPLKDFAPFSGNRKSGTFTHHGRAPGFRESIVPNTLSNLYQHFSGDSNSHQMLTTATDDHYYINFLHIYCYIIFIATLELDFSHAITTPPVIWGVTTRCEYCMKPISERPIVLDLSSVCRGMTNPLARTVIDQTAVEILQQSMTMFHAHEFNVQAHIDEIPYDVAIVGLLNELLDSTISHDQRLQARYTQHSTTKAAKSVLKYFIPQSSTRDISLTELKMIPSKQYLGPLVMTVGRLYLTLLNITDESDLHYTKCITIPSINLPWFNLVETLLRAGKLSAIINQLALLNSQERMVCFENPDTAAPYFGFLCAQAYQYSRVPHPFMVLLNNYKYKDIQRHVIHHVELAVWKHIRTNIIANLVVEDEDIEIHQCLMLCLSIMADNIHDEQVNVKNVESGKEYALQDIFTIDTDIFEDDLFGDIDYVKGLVKTMTKKTLNFLGIQSIEDVHHVFAHNRPTIYLITQWLEQTMITIYVTTFAACVLTVRNNKDDVDNDYSTAEIIKTPHGRPEMMCIHKPVTGGRIHKYASTVVHSIKTPTTDCLARIAEVYTELKNLRKGYKYQLSESCTHRIHGYLNSSVSNLEYILYMFHVKMTFGRTISCLGDGYGGFTELCSLWFPRSSILYNTKPASRVMRTVPERVNLNPHNTCSIISKHISAGVYDLTQFETVTHYAKVFPVNDIVACDAETHSDDVDNPDFIPHEQILMNVVWYFLETAHIHSLLILKSYWYLIEANAVVIQILSECCDFVYTVVPPSLNDIDTFYIIARGKRPDVQMAPEPLKFRDQISLEVMERTIVIMRNLIRIKQNELEQGKVVLKGKEINYADKYIKLSLPTYWITMANRHLGFVIPTNIKFGNTEPAKVKIYTIQQLFDCPKSVKHYKRHILTRKTVDIKGQQFDLDTRAHRDEMINQWARLHAFDQMLTFLLHTEKEYISMQRIYTYYIDFLDLLPPSDTDFEYKINRNVDEHIHENGHPVRYYNNFLLGCRIALSAYSHFLVTSG